MNASDSRDPLFQKRSDFFSFLTVNTHLLAVLAPLYLAALGPWAWWQLLLFSLWFGTGMNGLLNLLHECAHLHVFSRPSGSLFLGRWILGPLVIADFDGYQKRHWDHHRNLGKDSDPKYIYRLNVRGRKFILLILRCVFLLEAVKKFSVQTPSKKDTAAPSGNSLWIFRVAVAQGIFFLSVLLTARITAADMPNALRNALRAYFGVYLYGVAAVTVFVSSLRAIAEHQIGPDKTLAENEAALRNFSFGFFSGFLLGAYGFKDHASHHRDPGIPYYRLEIKTRELAAQDPLYAPARPYEKVLASLIRQR